MSLLLAETFHLLVVATPLTVCIPIDTPYNMGLNSDGTYSASALTSGWYNGTAKGSIFGLDSEYREKILSEMDVQYNVFVMEDYSELVYRTRKGFCDIGFASLVMQPHTEQCKTCPEYDGSGDYTASACCVDFSAPYFTTTIGLLSRIRESTTTSNIADLIISTNIANLALTLALFMVVGAHIVWVLDRTTNPEQFSPNYFEGIVSGIWWAAVTVTTVGYGDKSPKSIAAKVFGFVFMFAGFVITGIFAGTMTSNLMNNEITAVSAVTLDDMVGSAVCSIHNYLNVLNQYPIDVVLEEDDTLNDCLAQIKEGKAEAIYADRPVLEYALRMNSELSQQYAITDTPHVTIRTGVVFPEGSTLVRDFNIALATIQADQTWKNSVQEKWLGYDDSVLVKKIEFNWVLGIALVAFVGCFVIGMTAMSVYQWYQKQGKGGNNKSTTTEQAPVVTCGAIVEGMLVDLACAVRYLTHD